MSQQKVESPLFQQGLKDGLPICLGYISVAFYLWHDGHRGRPGALVVTADFYDQSDLGGTVLPVPP